MTGSDAATLAPLLQAAGVDAAPARRLATYGARLLDENRRFNLTAASTAELLLPHLLDSLTVVPYVRDPHVDIGSGGGLPAIPVAIALGVAVTMIESTGKKAAFLSAVAEELGLKGRSITARAEAAGHEPAFRGGFASATARAVSSAPTVLELTVPFLMIGGVAILQRGTLEARERQAAIDAAPMLGAAFEGQVEVDERRRILLFRKVTETPGRFPRRTGIPEKRPLCM